MGSDGDRQVEGGVIKANQRGIVLGVRAHGASEEEEELVGGGGGGV